MMKHFAFLFGLFGIFLFFATYGGLTATPKFWHDEAVPFEIARNIAEFGKADLAIAPNTFWEKSYMTHATGFPLTFPLAAIFKIFGVGVAQSRIFMIAWMLGMLTALFFIMQVFFDQKTAFFSVLLIATFSSFYANGRTGTGEIPGFLFLLFALYFLYQKEWYGWGGFFAALAAVTKPSMYLLVLPAITLELLVYAIKNIPNVFTFLASPASWLEGSPSLLRHSPMAKSETVPAPARKPVKTFGIFLLSIFFSALSVLLFWIWLINPAPFSLVSWQEMIAFYQNAFNAPSLLSQFPAVIPELLTHSTLIYFAALLIIIIFAWRRNFFTAAQNRLIIFLFFYGALSFFYFLRSPGWFRYLLGTELLILALLPASLQKEEMRRNALNIFTFFARPACVLKGSPSLAPTDVGAPCPLRARKPVKMLSAFLLIGIAIFQSAQYLLGAEIPSNTQSIEIAQFINTEILAPDPSATIGIVDYTPVAALIPANRKIQRIAVGGYNMFVGQHPLSLPPDQLPTYFVSTNQKKNIGYEDVLEKFYQPYREASHDVLIYKKNPSMRGPI